MDNASWKAQAAQHARDEQPREACGLVVIIKGKQEYWPCKNLAEGTEQFILDPADYAEAEDAGEIIAVVHSHPRMPATPSQADLVSIEAGDLPWYIVNPSTGQWSDELLPKGYKAPLIGREWVWGVTDCWTLAHDWYAENNLRLLDFERPLTPTEFESDPLFERSWKIAGFELIPDENPLERGDCILMAIGNKGLNHCGVYIGDGMMLHHFRKRLSSRDMYGGWLAKCTGRRLRHPELPKIAKG